MLLFRSDRGPGPALRGRHRLVFWSVLSGALVALLLLRPGILFDRKLPDFSEIEEVAERKSAFFEFLSPYIAEANTKILQQRRRLERLEDHLLHGPLNRREQRWVRDLAVQYDLELSAFASPGIDELHNLKKHIDIIPPSLALAQAALESGWGTSRFARQGNNLFGIWCYTPGCGIVPKRRPAGATYEVKAYSSPRDSFLDYIDNLNVNRAYVQLREIRQSLRQSGEPLKGLTLADGLFRYSEEGWTYVGKIKTMIRSNNLGQYDESIR